MKTFLAQLGLFLDDNNLKINLGIDQLVNESVEKGMGKLTKSGALTVRTGKHTGRAANDKYIVKTPHTQDHVWWENNVRKMSPDTFNLLKKEILTYLNNCGDVYLSDRSVGADPSYNLEVRLITPSPTHALFANHLFRDQLKDKNESQQYLILHAPFLSVDPVKYDARSETIITTDFDQKIVLIVGTAYAGEIKKSVFSIMNYLLPFEGVLPMHSGACLGERDEASVFFGLSGTGKTTLSTDKGKKLIGDDEHGLCAQGIFNFEGGCYAKTFELTREGEPAIYDAISKHGALLENVVIDDKGNPDYFDKSISENGRASYPLEFISERVENSLGPVPKHIFFLSADAFGVLPPVSQLTKNQAMFYFLSGYTSKLAGTEMGIVKPEATFSACFGAPFMIQRPQVYADLLGKFLDQHPETKVWLINTGWHHGPYGEGKRFPLKTTRQIIRSIQNDLPAQTLYHTESIFGLNIPETVEGVEKSLLNPKNCWKNPQDYNQKALNLAKMFKQNMEKLSNVSSQTLQGGPISVYQDQNLTKNQLQQTRP